MRKISIILLVLLAFSVYDEDEKEEVVRSAEELKEISTKKITWKEDQAKIVLIPAGGRMGATPSIMSSIRCCISASYLPIWPDQDEGIFPGQNVVTVEG